MAFSSISRRTPKPFFRICTSRPERLEGHASEIHGRKRTDRFRRLDSYHQEAKTFFIACQSPQAQATESPLSSCPRGEERWLNCNKTMFGTVYFARFQPTTS